MVTTERWQRPTYPVHGHTHVLRAVTAGAVAQGAGQVVTGALHRGGGVAKVRYQRKYGYGGGRGQAHLVYGVEDPAYGAVPTAGQDVALGGRAQLAPLQRLLHTTLAQVHHLRRWLRQ